MQQGDQYALPVKITDANGVVISPDNCYDVKIQVGDLEEKSWRAGEIYPQMIETDELADLRSLRDGENEEEFSGFWCYPLSQTETMGLESATQVQAQVKFEDGTIVGTPVQKLRVGQSIIQTTDWPEQE
jgi:hypothetical protein